MDGIINKSFFGIINSAFAQLKKRVSLQDKTNQDIHCSIDVLVILNRTQNIFAIYLNPLTASTKTIGLIFLAAKKLGVFIG